MRIAREYLISGRVQGVGFRMFTWEAAMREGLHGWVRNLPDGRVQVAAEGELDAVARFERQLRSGPRGARVEGFAGVEQPAAGINTGFDIR